MSASAEAFTGTTGHYAIYDQIASGGMATVHLGRVMGPVSFARTVAIKRLHPHLAREPEVVAMFLDEARMAARVRHPNVVQTLDIVTTHGSPFLVMEYVQGESLAGLLATLRANGQRISASIASSIVVGMLQGLHAAHEATGDRGEPLGLVHRDVSPQNVIVGLDGVARLLDFGVAKAAGRLQTTREGQIKGKLAYMAPEILRGGKVTRAADVYSAAVVFWETLTGERLFASDNEGNVIERVLFAEIVPPSVRVTDVPEALDPIVLRALARDPAQRYATAREMVRAIETAVSVARTSDIGAWVQDMARDALSGRARMVAKIESGLADPECDRPDVSAELLVSDETPGSGPIASRVTSAGADAARSRLRKVVGGIATIAGAVVALTVVLGLQSPGARTSNVTASAPAPERAAPQPAPPLPGTPSVPASEPPTIEADDLPVAQRSPPPTRAQTSRPHPPVTAKGASRNADVHEAPVPLFAGGARPKQAPKPSCQPPWEIDAKGIKQYKLECL
jgi:serine/threonine protein kinase